MQHALRAFTPDDEKALRAAARTFPKTAFYDVEETLTTLGIGEALVTVLAANGAPTPPFAARMIPPASRMGPLTPEELGRLSDAEQVRRYATAVDRDSAREMLARRLESPPAEPAPPPARPAPARPAPARPAPARPAPDPVSQVLRSPMARTVAREITRGLMGALFGPPPRHRRA